MDSSIGFKIDYIKSKGYQTIRKVPIEELPENQILAIFFRLRNQDNGVKKKVKPKEVESLKKNLNPFVETAPIEKEEQLTIEGVFN